MTCVARGKPPGVALVTSGATAETKKLYASMLGLCGTPYWKIGVHERYDALSPYPVPNTGRKPVDEFFQITGRYPASCQYEYVAASQPTGADGATGAAQHETMRQDMIAFARIGGTIGINDHFGNPNLGSMSNRMDSLTQGYVSSSPIPLVLTGGPQEARLLAYLDELAVFFNGLVNPDTGAKIPVLYRPMHEVNSNSFWWASSQAGSSSAVDATRQADYVTLWQKIVDYLRTTKGVTNVIYVWSLNAAMVGAKGTITDNASFPYSGWYPGDSYVDVCSLDFYNDGADSAADRMSIAGLPVRQSFDAICAIAGTAGKAVTLAEAGFEQVAGTRVDIWENAGKEMEQVLRVCYGMGLWRPPWGPALGQASNDSLRRMAASRYCLTLDKLPPV